MDSVGGRVLVVVDDEEERVTLDAQLRALGFETAATTSTVWLDAVVRAHQPQAIVLGVGTNHLEASLRVADHIRQTSTCPFVLAGSWLAMADRIACFRAGADDVIRTPCPDEELEARLLVVIRRRAAAEPDVLELDGIVVDTTAHVVLRDGNPVAVTSVEFALLRHLLRHRGQVLSKTQLLAEVWGYEHYDVNLVEVHVSALRRKLEAFGPRVLHTVRGVGYVLRAPAGVAAMASA